MPKNIQVSFKLKNFIIIFLTPILLLGFFIEPARAGMANHVVISEIQAGTKENGAEDEFVELYNPTDQSIDLAGWELRKKNSNGNENNLVSIKKFVGVIKTKSFFLVAHENYKGNVLKDLVYSANSNNLSYKNNSVVLYDSNSQPIDEVIWTEILEGQSLERKAYQNNGCISAQNIGETLGNGCDTGDLSDFEIRAIPNSQNSQSAAELAVESLPTSTPNPTSAPRLSPEPSLDPITSAVSFQSVLPIAEAGSDKEAVIGENLDFDGSDSFDPAGKKLSFVWDFGDKTSDKGENVSHVYKASGDYVVILKVGNGENISEDTLKVKIVVPEFSDKIILSEILPNPIGADNADNGEWIEIFNSGDKKVNLKGWILATAAKTSGKQYVFAGDKVIEAKSYLVVKRSESGLVLTNENGKASLVWPPDKIISEVVYGVAKEGKSHAFIGNAWQWADTPTPGKENSAKVLATATPAPKAKENIASVSGSVKNVNVSEVFNDIDEENPSGKNVPADNITVNALLAKSTVLQLEKSFSAEGFLDKLIAEKVDKAILKAKTAEAPPKEKVLALAENAGEKGIAGANKEVACKDFCLEKNTATDSEDVRNNIWFWGDLFLGGLCLFLVWRYQVLRKKLN